MALTIPGVSLVKSGQRPLFTNLNMVQRCPNGPNPEIHWLIRIRAAEDWTSFGATEQDLKGRIIARHQVAIQ